jgi:hypothetical protein
MMNWEAVSIIAQIGTSIATLAVAIFLASQLRIQHKDSERQFLFANQRLQMDYILSIASDESTSNLWWKGQDAFETLSENELMRFRYLVQQAFVNTWHAWEVKRDGDDYTRFRRQWAFILQYEGSRKYYERWGKNMLESLTQDKIFLNMAQNAYEEKIEF